MHLHVDKCTAIMQYQICAIPPSTNKNCWPIAGVLHKKDPHTNSSLWVCCHIDKFTDLYTARGVWISDLNMVVGVEALSHETHN